MSNFAQNINRDYFVKMDVKTSKVTYPNMYFYITDDKTCNILVQLVISMNTKDIVKDYVILEEASSYKLKLNIIKPNNEPKEIEGKLLDDKNSLYLFDLGKEYRDVVGTYKCELLVTCTVNKYEEQITSDSFKYTVKPSILNDLDEEIEADEKYPILLDLINQIQNGEIGGGGTGYSNIWISADGTEPPNTDYQLWIDLSDNDEEYTLNYLQHELLDTINSMSNRITELETELAELVASGGIINPPIKDDDNIIDAILTAEGQVIWLDDNTYLMAEGV